MPTPLATWKQQKQEKLPFQREEVQSYIQIWTREFGLTPLAQASFAFHTS
jgi:hypothetical protein